MGKPWLRIYFPSLFVAHARATPDDMSLCWAGEIVGVGLSVVLSARECRGLVIGIGHQSRDDPPSIERLARFWDWVPIPARPPLGKQPAFFDFVIEGLE